MKTQHLNVKKQMFTSFEETAKMMGIPTQQLIDLAKAEGLLTEEGIPTELAIKEGLLRSFVELKLSPAIPNKEEDEVTIFETFYSVKEELDPLGICENPGIGLKIGSDHNTIVFSFKQIIQIHGFMNEWLKKQFE